MTTKSEALQEEASELATAHWAWFDESVNRFSDAKQTWTFVEMMEDLEWMFINAFKHGYKHGVTSHD